MGTDPIMGSPPSRPHQKLITFPSTPLPDTLMSAVKASASNLRETPCQHRTLSCLLGSSSMCFPVKYLSLDNVFIGIMVGGLSGTTISADFYLAFPRKS